MGFTLGGGGGQSTFVGCEEYDVLLYVMQWVSRWGGVEKVSHTGC